MGKQILFGLMVALTLAGSTGALERSRETVEGAVTFAAAASGWIIRSEDNICGLSDPKKLSNPGRLRYSELKEATPEIKRMKEKHIDPESPEGIQLKQAAVDRIRTAADEVRGERGHCSVWKKIRNRDGRTVPDLTDLVKKRF